MSCKECGCNKVAERGLEEKTNDLSLSAKQETSCACSAKAATRSCCSNSSNVSRPGRGCSCCCRSCCACCRCCSGTIRDICQDRVRETTSGSCQCCNKREVVTRPTACACQN